MTKQHTRSERVGAWVRTGLVSASLAKPVVDILRQRRAANTPTPAVAARGRLGDVLPLTQAQIESLARDLSGRMGGARQQARTIAGRVAGYPAKVDRRVWWAAGAAVGFIAAGVTAFVLARRRLARTEEMEALVVVPAANGQHAPADRLKGIVSRLTRRDADTATQPGAVGVQTSVAVVGNLRTMVYHQPDSDHLPAEDNRVYFTSEQDAIDAGYRADISE